MRLTRDLAFAASKDAGNRSMRAGGRTSWSEEDQDAAAANLIGCGLFVNTALIKNVVRSAAPFSAAETPSANSSRIQLHPHPPTQLRRYIHQRVHRKQTNPPPQRIIHPRLSHPTQLRRSPASHPSRVTISRILCVNSAAPAAPPRSSASTTTTHAILARTQNPSTPRDQSHDP